MNQKFDVSGMTCSACSAHVEKSVRKLDGVDAASVNLLTESMQVEYDGGKLKETDIIAAVERAGYGARPAAKTKRDTKVASSGKDRERDGAVKQAREEKHRMMWRLGVSAAFLLPLMYVAMFHMIHAWLHIPVPSFMTAAFHGNGNALNFALTQFLLVLPILYVNRKFFIVGFKTLFGGSPNMDSLVALGAAAAVCYGIFALYRIGYGLGHGQEALVAQYSHDLYFESAGMILTLITVGKYLETRSKGKTGEAITKLMDLSPRTAVILSEDGKEREVPTEEVREGDVFLVKPGGLVPVDGEVLEGNSSVDEAAITGESVPAEKRPGDAVVSATVNKSGFLKCRARKVGEDTTLAQIIRLVEEAAASKAPIAQLADKISGVFVPIVIGIALVTLAAWLAAGASFEFAISAAIAVLVISCPCALGLATPVAIMVGTGVGARNGILIKSGEALQEARDIDTVVLDKTGTITEGRLKVLQTGVSVPDMSVNTLLLLAGALEKKSEHPLAEAVLAEAERTGRPLPGVRDFKATFGRGVEGVLAEDIEPGPMLPEDGPTACFAVGKTDGKTAVRWLRGLDAGVRAGTKIYVGNLRFMEDSGVAPPESEKNAADGMAEEGMTPLFVAEEARFLGCIGVADEIKSTSFAAVHRLKRMGVRVVMLTGDNRRTAEAVRERMDIEEVIAEVLPQDKERHISGLRRQGHKVAMVGDGINDAPALAAADVGIAIGAGTDVAMESADIILMKNDLRDAVTAIRLSKSVIRNIGENLFWAFFYNSVGIPLAAGVLYPAFQLKLNPMFAAAAMSLSSVCVVANALRLRRFRSGWEEEGKAQAVRRTDGTEGQETGKEGKKMYEYELSVEGMMCGHCQKHVTEALAKLPAQAAVDLEGGKAFVKSEKPVDAGTFRQVIADAGYELKDVKEKA